MTEKAQFYNYTNGSIAQGYEMRLENTKEYYRDLAHYYFCKGKMYLMQHFHELFKNNGNKNIFNTEDTKDWFKWSQTKRPVWDTESKAYVGDII